MNDHERQIAIAIWPEKILERIRDPQPYPYSQRVIEALDYLGDEYLCARDVNVR